MSSLPLSNYRARLEADPLELLCLPDEVFDDGPELLEVYLPRVFACREFTATKASAFSDKLVDLVPLFDEFIINLWTTSGGPWIESVLRQLNPESVSSPSFWEKGLLHYCRREDYLVASLPFSPTALRSDVCIMSNLINQHPNLFALAATNVQRAVFQQVQSYDAFHFLWGRMIEQADAGDQVDEYEGIIAEYLGSSRLRRAISSYHATLKV